MDWEKFRRADHTIDLSQAFDAVYKTDARLDHPKAHAYLGMIETLRPIGSRQLAAIALATAEAIAL